MFERIKEFKALAKAFNGIFIYTQSLKLKNLENVPYDSEEIITIAYLSRREIIDRIQIFEWNHQNPIYIPSISTQKVTIEHALNLIMTDLKDIANVSNVNDQVNNILNKGYLFHELDAIFPKNLNDINFML